MCGIAGTVALPGGPPIRPEALAEMLEVIAHRGPDDEGTYVSSDGRLALGHRRLAILDTGRAGHQPMRHDRFLIVFNGEIYNYRELAEELRQLGHRFQTRSDTEVILHAYQQWGRECLKRFIGMWAFAIYDETAGQLFCARDPFGIKPFYFSRTQSAFCFASEQKALLKIASRPRVDYAQLAAYLALGITDHDEATFFESIRQLRPGHWLALRCADTSVEEGCYFDLRSEVIRAGRRSIEDFGAAFSQSVRLHLRSDVAVGTCLSGGLDSSAVAATASLMYRQERGDEGFFAVTAGSEDKSRDEREYARQVAEKCNLSWRPFVPSYADFAKDLRACLWHQDEPVGGPSVFMQYCVMRQARTLGLKVLLDGQGGDELLLGYERYYATYFRSLARRGRPWQCIREFSLASRNSRLNVPMLAAYFGYFSSPRIRRAVLRRRLRWLRPDLLESTRSLVQELAECQANLLDLQVAEVSRFNLPHLLKYEDRNSMAHGIEARVPFVERDTLIAALAMDARDKIRDGYTKYALRRVMDGRLPPAIAWRRNKIGFEAPTQRWLNAHSEQVASAIGGSAILRSIGSQPPTLRGMSPAMIWRLYNVSVWEEMFGVSI